MMSKTFVYHRSIANYAYVNTDGSLHIRLKADKHAVKDVHLLFSDPYEWSLICYPMSIREYEETFTYWFVSIKPKYNRLSYCFHVFEADDAFVYCENGMYKEPPTKASACFSYPYVRKEDAMYIPEWFRQSVFYQIFPDRFCRLEENSANDSSLIPWNSQVPTSTSVFGGNIKGIITKLAYLQRMGINAIYLNPIFEAETNHRYDTMNYYEVDPLLGGKDSLKVLVDECHKRGIRIVLDGVFNHCSHHHPFFQDALDNPSSLYRDWFIFHNNNDCNYPYEMFAFESYMPKFNTHNPCVQDYLIEVALYWIINCDIDGWRLDVITEISQDFVRRLRRLIQEVKPDAILIGEIWQDALPWLSNSELHTATNYRLREIFLDFLVYNKTTPLDFAQSCFHLSVSYPLSFCMFNLLGSHDTARIFTLCDNSIQKLKLLFIALFSFPGTPCIYYGDEIGLPGGEDPLCRACMPWNEFTKEQNELFNFICELIRWRNKYKEDFGSNEIEFVPTNDFILSYIKNGHFIFILNPCENTALFQIPSSFQDFTVILSSRVLMNNENLIQVKSFDYFVLMKNSTWTQYNFCENKTSSSLQLFDYDVNLSSPENDPKQTS